MTENYLIKVPLLLILFVVLFFLFVRYLEKKSLYFPLRKIEVTPGTIGLKYEEVIIKAEDGNEITGWYIFVERPRATLLFCHGNGGNISHRIEKIRILNALNADVLIFDYRGYGMSSGSPSEEGLYLDAEAMYGYLVKEKKLPPQKIIAFGESLGGAVAVDLASKHELGGIIIEEGFTSVKDMAKILLPFIPTFIYRTGFDSVQKIKGIKSPKLIFHSADDEIVPFRLGRKLFDVAMEPKYFVEIRGGHNDAFLISGDVFASEIDSFINRVGE